ncbi:hypothetical protein SANA_07150 [Gottschalkiaceae bacterium SANA]|nr:hypothetical protein SANA_07150 [Gottschalkiaceae bacterium SANA]
MCIPFGNAIRFCCARERPYIRVNNQRYLFALYEGMGGLPLLMSDRGGLSIVPKSGLKMTKTMIQTKNIFLAQVD